MDERGYIKLSDFGLSKQTDHTSTFCGTADYLAPEMVAGNKHNKNIDWWMLVRSAHCRESTSTKCSPDRLPSPAATRCRSAKKSKR